MTDNRAKETVQSVLRCLDLLEAVAQQDRSIGVSELSRQLCLSKATVHRLCQTLLDRQFFQQDAKTCQYSPGPRLLELTCRLAGQLDLKRVSRPILEQMAADARQNAFAGTIVHDGEMLIYDEIRVDNPVQPRSLLGLRLPLRESSDGLLRLAGPLSQKESPKHPGEATAPAQRSTDEMSYIVQVDVPYADVTVVCSPVFDQLGRATGILGFCHPAMKQAAADPKQLGPKCAQAAKKLSTMQSGLGCQRLGGATPKLT